MTTAKIRQLLESATAKIDGPLIAIVLCILALGLATLYSAAYQAPGRVGAQALNVLLALLDKAEAYAAGLQATA